MGMGNGKMTLPTPSPLLPFGWLSPLVQNSFFPQFSAAVKIKDGSFDLQRQGLWRKISNKELLVHLAR